MGTPEVPTPKTMPPDATVQDHIENWFTYHPPQQHQIAHYNVLRDGAKAFALLIAEHTPQSPDQSAALRLVREAVMTANAAIACGGF